MVSYVSKELDISLEEAERMLDGMVDGHRVVTSLRDSGAITYDFIEVKEHSDALRDKSNRDRADY